MGDGPDLIDRGEASIARLFDRHAAVVFRLALSVLRDPDDAQDVVQDTFVVAWRKRRSITLVDGSALPWLLTTARLTALAHRRRAIRRRTADLPGEGHPAVPSETDAAAAVRAALEGLPPPDRAVVALVLIDGYSYAEAAARLGLTTSAAGKRLQRARTRLRNELRPEGTS